MNTGRRATCRGRSIYRRTSSKSFLAAPCRQGDRSCLLLQGVGLRLQQTGRGRGPEFRLSEGRAAFGRLPCLDGQGLRRSKIASEKQTQDGLLKTGGKPMLFSRMFLPTMKEEPKEAEVVSHRLMLRAGFIRRLSAGIYTWLPLGLKSLRKVERIIREEMDRAGAQEILMPAVQPKELWVESGRWDFYGKELFGSETGTTGSFASPRRTKKSLPTSFGRRLRSYRGLPLQPLPDTDEVPRRDKAQVRRDAAPESSS